MKTTISLISVLMTLTVANGAFAKDRQQTTTRIAQPLPETSVVIAPPAIVNPIFSNIPDVAPVAK